MDENYELYKEKEKKDNKALEAKLNLISELEAKVVRDGLSSKSAKERMLLLQEVFSNDDFDDAKAIFTILSTSLEDINEKSLEALNALSGASSYLAAYSLLKYRPNSPILSDFDDLLNLSKSNENKVMQSLYKSLKLIKDNPSSQIAQLFQRVHMPEIIRKANYLSQAAVDTMNYLKDPEKNTVSWVKEQFRNKPIASASIVTLGAIGLGTLFYKSLSLMREKAPLKVKESGTAADGNSIIKRTTSVMSYMPRTLFAMGGLSLAGMLLGAEQTQEFLERNMTGNLAFIPKMLYKNRISASFIHLCSGRVIEAIATMSFGARSAKDKMRHNLYAEYFEVKENSIWAVCGVKLKDLLNADPARKYPVSAGFLKNIPLFNEKIEKSGLKLVEDRIKKKFLEEMPKLMKIDPQIKDKTIDEAIRLAFANGIFNSLEKYEEEKTNEDEKSVNGEIADYKATLDSIMMSESLNESQIEYLKESSVSLQQELDEIRLAIPMQFDELKKSFARAFPIPMIESMEDIIGYENQDLIKTQEFYQTFAKNIKDSEESSILKDLNEIKNAHEFFANLKVGLNGKSASLHIKNMKEIHQKIKTWRLRAEKSRKNAIQEDAKQINLEDLGDVLTFYYLGYSNIPYYLRWSVQKLKDKESRSSEKVIALSAGIGSAALITNLGVAAYQFKNGNVVKALERVVLPGPHITYEAFTFNRNFGHILGFNTPETILKKFASGKLSSSKAIALCKAAIEHEDLFKNSAKWGDRMREFKTLMNILDDNANDIATFAQDPHLVRSIDATPDHEISHNWKKQLKTIVREKFNMSLEDFFTQAKAEKAMRLSEKIKPESLARALNTLAKKLNLPEIPYESLVNMLAKDSPLLSFIKLSMNRGIRYGLPMGAVLLSSYFACDVVYRKDSDKIRKFALFGIGLASAELAVTGASILKNTAHGIAITSKMSKHPIVIGIGALLGALGITFAVENAIEPHLKTKDPIAAGLIAALGSSLYTIGLGHLNDGYMHKWKDKGAKEYFMRTTFRPVLPWKWKESGGVHMAFEEGKSKDYDEQSVKRAIEIFNAKIRERIAEAERNNSKEEVEYLRAQIIDGEWEIRQSILFDMKKIQIMDIGAKLESEIFKKYDGKLSKRESALVSSLLTVDVPYSWLDEEFLNIEDEPRVALIKKLSDKDPNMKAMFDNFIAMKRDIQSDIQFYQLIDMDEKIVTISEEEKNKRIFSLLDVNDDQIKEAETVFNSFQDSLGIFES